MLLNIKEDIRNYAKRILPEEILICLDDGMLSGTGNRTLPYLVSVDENGPYGQFAHYTNFRWGAVYGKKKVSALELYWKELNFERATTTIFPFFIPELFNEVKKHHQDYYRGYRKQSLRGEWWEDVYYESR
jgi:hypothetical protein